MRRNARPPWWHGRRGEWYVVAQFVLIAVVFLCPRTHPGLPAWSATLAGVATVGGALLLVAGVFLLATGVFRLGVNLTPLPYPKTQSTLVRSGPYGVVRHPIYAGLILLAYGWAFLVRGWLTLVYATTLFIFFEVKSAREERWLIEKFPEYLEYQRRVRKLIPFVH